MFEKKNRKLPKPKCQCIPLGFLAHFYTEANPGQHRAKIKCLPCALYEEASWDIMDELSNTVVLSIFGLPAILMMLHQQRHVRQMKEGKIPAIFIRRTNFW